MQRGRLWRFGVDVVAWAARHYRVGELPVVLDGEPAYRDDTEHGEMARTATDELARVGVLGRRGLDPDFADLLAVLCRPQLEYYGWFAAEGRTVGMLSAVLGQMAVVAVRDGDAVTFREIRPSEVLGVLVSELPPHRPAGFTPINTRMADLAAAGAGDSSGGPQMLQRPVSTVMPAEMRLLVEIATGKRSGSGQFFVAMRDAMGRRRVSPEPLGVVDTPRGRVLLTITHARGERWVLVAPATAADLVTRLRQMSSQLGG